MRNQAIIRQTNIKNIPDLRTTQEDFCLMWGCEKTKSTAPCTYCPVIRDLFRMAHEQRMLIDGWEYDSLTAYVDARKN